MKSDERKNIMATAKSKAVEKATENIARLVAEIEGNLTAEIAAHNISLEESMANIMDLYNMPVNMPEFRAGVRHAIEYGRKLGHGEA